jgi:hypothetical protein
LTAPAATAFPPPSRPPTSHQQPAHRLLTSVDGRITRIWSLPELAPGGVIVVDVRGSLDGCLLRLTTTDPDVVEGSFVNLPGAFMPLRTRLDSPHRDGENWEVVLDQRNPQRGSPPVNPALVAENRSLRFLTQLHLAGRRLRGFVPDDEEISGHCTDGSWFTAGLHPGDDGLYPVAQGGPQRLWDTLESSYFTWRRLGEPGVEHFGVTALDDTALQYVCSTTQTPSIDGHSPCDKHRGERHQLKAAGEGALNDAAI